MSSLRHIAFIPDGNRRWAREKGLSSLEGHRQGFLVMKKVARWCFEMGLEEVTFWGFSTENWKRSKEEVGYLLDLFTFFLRKEITHLLKDEIRFRFIGSFEGLSETMQKAIRSAEELTTECSKGVINMCFNYGGREEIVQAVKKAVALKADTKDVDAIFVDQLFHSAPLSDIDVIVRTSGEQRLSGFQPWKGAFSELIFLKEQWPDFAKSSLDFVLEEFSRRQRRFGV